MIESHEDYPPLEIELFSQSTMRYISEFQSSLPIGISLTEEIEITPPSFPPSLLLLPGGQTIPYNLISLPEI